MRNVSMLLLCGVGFGLWLSCKDAVAPAPIQPVPTPEEVKKYQTLRDNPEDNILHNAYVEANNIRSRQFSPCKVNDKKWDTYWATDDSVSNAVLTFTLNTANDVNSLMIQEYMPLGGRVEAFNIEYEAVGNWLPVETTDSMATVGFERIIRFQTVRAERLRINFTQARGPLCINNVEAYLE